MITVQLIVVQGKPEGKAIPLTAPVFRIGRDPSCHLRPSSDRVSRQHAELAIGATEVILKDLGSRNGTKLNGRTITGAVKLKSGDLVKVGPLTFAVSIQGAPVEAAPPAGARPASPPSLDEVPQEQVEAWLIADAERPLPDRPSGVYGGETITLQAFQGGAPKSDPAVKVPPPERQPAARATGPQAASTAPEPQPVVEAPQPQPRAAQSPTSPPDAPPVPSPEPGSNSLRNAPRSFLDELENIEQLPEGEGDAEPEAEAIRAEGSESGATGEVPDEFVDESNPFYIAREAAPGPTKPQPSKGPFHKDCSDAASEILKKMFERRRNR